MDQELFDNLTERMEKDAEIDYGNLGHESIKTPSLYANWQKIYMNQATTMKRLDNELNQLYLHLKLYYGGKAPDSVMKANPLPSYLANVTILKGEIDMYIKADPKYCELSSKLEMQRVIVASIEGYMKNSISNRTFAIKNAVDYIKFQSGG